MLFNLTVHLKHLISISEVIVMQETLPFFSKFGKKFLELTLKIISWGNIYHSWPDCIRSHYNMGLIARKPVFRVSDKASFKPVSSATENS